MAGANGDGWYKTLEDNFDGDSLNTNVWAYSPHAKRWETGKKGKDNQTSYWCPNMVKVNNGNLEILAEERADHVCDVCPSVGRFSGGIETRRVIGNDQSNSDGKSDDLLFSQAFGYFETRVKFPNAKGMWSAFWLQSSNMRKLGNGGVDGTEIDIYESAFGTTPTKMGHALLWDGYRQGAKVDDYIVDTGKNLYDGYHTFALKWTPTAYIFYVDGVATWSSSGGGVSKVKEFLRLTVEIDEGDGHGPHYRKIGQFGKDTSATFFVDYVKVYQNKHFLKYVIEDEKFAGELDKFV
ncbi:MAG: glycoside hydrolase family 16 protein [Clostridia bacterium]